MLCFRFPQSWAVVDEDDWFCFAFFHFAFCIFRVGFYPSRYFALFIRNGSLQLIDSSDFFVIFAATIIMPQVQDGPQLRAATKISGSVNLYLLLICGKFQPLFLQVVFSTPSPLPLSFWISNYRNLEFLIFSHRSLRFYLPPNFFSSILQVLIIFIALSSSSPTLLSFPIYGLIHLVNFFYFRHFIFHFLNLHLVLFFFNSFNSFFNTPPTPPSRKIQAYLPLLIEHS